jgi:hypothetical protein
MAGFVIAILRGLGSFSPAFGFVRGFTEFSLHVTILNCWDV